MCLLVSDFKVTYLQHDIFEIVCVGMVMLYRQATYHSAKHTNKSFLQESIKGTIFDLAVWQKISTKDKNKTLIHTVSISKESVMTLLEPVHIMMVELITKMSRQSFCIFKSQGQPLRLSMIIETSATKAQPLL